MQLISKEGYVLSKSKFFKNRFCLKKVLSDSSEIKLALICPKSKQSLRFYTDKFQTYILTEADLQNIMYLIDYVYDFVGVSYCL